MPKIIIDYSNTIIYKIFCKDPNVSDIYVGHTTNFVQRKHAHKQNSMNSKSPCYDLKLYKIIRDNGGWDNWKITELEKYDACQTKQQSLDRVKMWQKRLDGENSTFSTHIPAISTQNNTFFTHIPTFTETSPKQCKFCHKIYSRTDSLKRHIPICKQRKMQDQISNEHDLRMEKLEEELTLIKKQNEQLIKNQITKKNQIMVINMVI